MEHRPNRPAWDCTACGEPWPCEPAREELVVESRGIRAAMIAWDYLEVYCGDQPQAPSAGLFERFIAWTRRVPLDGPR